MIQLNTSHPGIRNVWFFGGGINGVGSDNISILFSNGHQERISMQWEEGIGGIQDCLIHKATEYVNSLNGGDPELIDEELLYASEEDWAFYRAAIDGLPTREGFKGNFMDKDNVEIPYGSGPHILKHFREAIGIVEPSCVLEIGFNCGHGAAMLLKLGVNVDSIDISDKWETKYAALFLEKKHDDGQFRYWIREEYPNIRGIYKLAFVDGAHDEASIFEDIVMCEKLRIPYLLFDDWYERYGETQKAVAQFPELELVKDMNNLRLYKVNY